MARVRGRYRFRRSFRDDRSPSGSPLWPEIHYPVGGLDDVEVVLDDDDCVALVDQGLKDTEEFANVFEVQAGGGFIEYVDGAARRALLQFAGELHTLRLSPGQRWCRLSHPHVSEPHINQRGQVSCDRRHRLEEGQGVFYRKI